MSVVLFLGAGFSAPFGLPVMSNFLMRASRCKRLDTEDKELLNKLVLHARKSNAFLQSSPTNLEDTLTMAVMAERLKLPIAQEVPLRKLRTILAKVLSDHGSPELAIAKLNPFRKLLEPITSRSDTGGFSIVTTNYDLCVEAGCEIVRLRPELPFEYDLPPNGQQRKEPMSSSRCFPLLKLHGSINWLENSLDQTRLFVDELQARVFTAEGEVPIPSPWTDTYPWNSGTPMLVPPSYLKPTLNEQLSRCWERASAELSRAEAVIFIGYSFPSSDSEMRYFLATSLTDNPNIRNIYVVDLHASEIVERLKNSDSRFGSHFSQFLVPIDGDWTHKEPIKQVVTLMAQFLGA